MNQASQILGTQPFGKLLARQSVPATIGMIGPLKSAKFSPEPYLRALGSSYERMQAFLNSVVPRLTGTDWEPGAALLLERLSRIRKRRVKPENN